MFHKLFNDDTKLFSSKLFSKSLFAVAGAFIEYLMTMSTNPDKTVVMDNTGTSGTTNSGLAYGSNWLYLDGSTQSFDVGLPHTLGADLSNNTVQSVGTQLVLVDNGNGTYTITGTVVGTSQYFVLHATPIGNIPVITELDVTVNTGSASIVKYYDGVSSYDITPILLSNATFEIENKTRENVGTYFYFADGDIVDITITPVSIKEISNNTAYLNKIDHATKEVVSIANQSDGSESSVERVSNGTFDTDINGYIGSDAASGVSWDPSQRLKLTNNDATAAGVIPPSVEVEAGKTYIFRFDSDQGTSNHAGSSLGFGTSAGSPDKFWFPNGFATNGSHSYTYTSDFTGTGYILIKNVTIVDTESMFYDNISVKEVLPISTVYNETQSGQEWFATTKTLTDADRTYWTANPNAIRELWAGETVVGLSFDKTDMYTFYLGNEGDAGGEFVQDVMQDLGATNPNNTFTSATSGVGNTISTVGNITTIHNEVATTVNFYPIVNTTSTISNDPSLYRASFIVEVTSGTAFVSKIEYSNSSLVWGSIKQLNETLPVGVYEFVVFGYYGSTNQINLLFDGKTTETVFNTTVTTVIRLAIASEIENFNLACRAQLKNLNYGASNRLTIQDATGRITGIADQYTGEYKDPDGHDNTQWDGTDYGYVGEVYHDGTAWVHFLYLANGDRYKNSVSDGTYTMKALVGGAIHLDENSFDGVATTITRRGIFRASKSILSTQTEIDAVYADFQERYL